MRTATEVQTACFWCLKLGAYWCEVCGKPHCRNVCECEDRYRSQAELRDRDLARHGAEAVPDAT